MNFWSQILKVIEKKLFETRFSAAALTFFFAAVVVVQKLSFCPGVGEVVFIILHDWNRKKKEGVRGGRTRLQHSRFSCYSRSPWQGGALRPVHQLSSSSAPSD